MPELARITVGLRIFGDDLELDEVTRLLGIGPTNCRRKGDIHYTATSCRKVVAQSGSWLLSTDVVGNLNTQIGALLAMLPSDPFIWRELSRRYRCDVFCGLFMRDINEGTELQPQILSLLGSRGLRLGLDIYEGSDGSGLLG